MNIHRLAFVITCSIFLTIHAPATVRYVDLNSINPTPPYTSWATAATNIQIAVDAAAVGDVVLVTNGVYRTDGKSVISLTNRVAIAFSLTVQSVNGPSVTSIEGRQVPGTTNGFGALRCVYLAAGATLSGFTITNGATEPNNDGAYETSGGGVYCESADSIVTNCVFINNSAAIVGGGASGGTLNNCTLIGNRSGYGGGIYNNTANNCGFTGNRAGFVGGGAEYSTLNNCTLTGNSASGGGGASDSTLNNCIVYFNSAPGSDNYSGCTFNFSCTAPLPGGTGNLGVDPQLTDSIHLGPASPCRGTGSANYVTGVDIDGEAWSSPPSMGCDEYHPGDTGPLNLIIQADYTNVTASFLVRFSAQIAGHASSSHWDFGDGSGTDNQPLFASHGWAATGSYPVVLTTYNDSNPGGVSATVTVSVVTQPVHYVSRDNSNPVAPYSSWNTAATNIQNAVDAATVPGALVLVTNGIYQTGAQIVFGTMSNRLAVTRPAIVRSVNGPAVTVIQGRQVPDTINGDSAVRCVYLTSGAVLAGFTLAGGATRNDGDWNREQSGGGLWCASASVVVSNCVLAGNSAAGAGGGSYGGTLYNCTLLTNSAATGGGVYQGTLDHCLLLTNSAAGYGGGTAGGLLSHCTLTGNAADYGGGASDATLNDCLLASNSAFDNGGGATDSTLMNCSLSGNSAYWGGGANSSTLQSSVLSNNTAVLNGGGAISSTLDQCTLSGNSGSYGGGASDSTLTSCTLSNNFAVLFDLEGGFGAGVVYCGLANCLLTGNSAAFIGGGADGSTLNNCTLVGNSAGSSGGGAAESTLNNSIVYFNTAPAGPNFAPPTEAYSGCALNFCCTTPAPDDGAGNFTNAPLTGGNFQLQASSLCINSGNNAYVAGASDLAGSPRIQGGTVDIGAYEFQSPTSVISYLWLQQHGFTNNGSADYADPDGDGFNNRDEWRAGTSPADPSSLLRITTATNDVSGITVTWQSVSGVTYILERSTDLGAQPAFVPIQTDIAGQAGTTSATDADVTGIGLYLYRVGVQ